jgi:hypothetical protein
MGVLAYPRLSEPIRDVIRASSLIVLLIVAFVWFNSDLSLLYIDLFHSFAPSLAPRIPNPIKLATVTIFDALTHVVPCLLVGLPQFAHSLIFALCVVLLWYRWARNKIQSIYSHLITTRQSDRAMLMVSVAVLLAVCIGWFEFA